MKQDSERIAVLETLVIDLPDKFERVFEILGQIKENQSEYRPRLKSLEDYRTASERNTNNIMDWIGKTKGSIMTLKYIYPIVQAMLIAVVVYFK